MNSKSVLLLEGVSVAAKEFLADRGYQVTSDTRALDESDLLDIAEFLRIVGIRSRTKLKRSFFEKAKNLIAVGCFCIGSDQVDMQAASEHGVAVFNAPFSSTRSVAELTMAQIVMLARRAGESNLELHAGVWKKDTARRYEVRGKTLGIVGYGHIGPQVGLLAESFGMSVCFYDIVNKLPLGNAKKLSSLEELLKVSDFVSLHVPDTVNTRNMITSKELSFMKPGSYLLNLSRGSVVNLEDLSEALSSQHIRGTALDVYPVEPVDKEAPFEHPIKNHNSAMLTPHIGGATEEAQINIALEVAKSLADFDQSGDTIGSLNFPGIHLPVHVHKHRLLNVHKNVPGVLRSINDLIAETGANIEGQSLETKGPIGYLLVDSDRPFTNELLENIKVLDATICSRILF